MRAGPAALVLGFQAALSLCIPRNADAGTSTDTGDAGDQSSRIKLALGWAALAVPNVALLVHGIDTGHGQGINGAAYLPLAATIAGPAIVALVPVPITDGMETLGLHGMLVGFVHGDLTGTLLTGHQLLGLEGQTFLPPRLEWALKDGEMLMATTSVVEGLGGATFGAIAHVTPGGAVAIDTAGDLGTLMGLGAGIAFHLDASPHSPRLLPALGLAGALAGYATGALVARWRHYSLGQAEALRATVYLGAWVGGAIDLSLQPYNESHATAASILAGASLAGAVVGDFVASRSHLTPADVWLLYFEGFAGAGIGTAIGAAINKRDGPSALIFLPSAAGAIAGFTSAWLIAELTANASTPPRSTASTLAMTPFLGARGQLGLSVGGQF